MLSKNKSLKLFLIGYTAFLIPAIFIILNNQRGDTIIWINSIASNNLDPIFQFITYFGLGGFFAIPIFIYLFTNFSHAITGAISISLTGIFTYLFKQILFPNILRPTGVLRNGELTHFIYGFDYHITNSFPSGHTMTAFALFLLLSITINKKSLVPLFLISAVLIAISRMYLLQHFLIDVTVGSVLGIICTLLGFKITHAIFKNNTTIMEGNLITIFKK